MEAAYCANLPSLHEMQAEPVLEWNWPATQFVQAVAGEVAYWPLAHTSHEAALYVVVIWPCGHGVQLTPP